MIDPTRTLIALEQALHRHETGEHIDDMANAILAAVDRGDGVSWGMGRTAQSYVLCCAVDQPYVDATDVAEDYYTWRAMTGAPVIGYRAH